MADTFKLATVTAAIAAMGASITVANAKNVSVGMSILDITDIPDVVEQSKCPVLRPRVDNFLTLDNGPFLARDTTGADAAKKTFKYAIHYKFFFCPIGQGNALLGPMWAKSVTAVAAAMLYFCTHTNDITGATDVLPRLDNLNPQADSAGTLFHGGEISFMIDQYAEA